MHRNESDLNALGSICFWTTLILVRTMSDSCGLSVSIESLDACIEGCYGMDLFCHDAAIFICQQSISLRSRGLP